jgi:hypothetical protein
MRRILMIASLACSVFMTGNAAATDLSRITLRVFRATLTGAEEVPPVESRARGRISVFARLRSLEYSLVLSNAREVVAAHIHCGQLGENGPIGVTLYASGPVTVNGTYAHGPILAPDINNDCNWKNVGDIVQAAVSGNAYVNVHTDAHPRGEIRGQLK